MLTYEEQSKEIIWLKAELAAKNVLIENLKKMGKEYIVQSDAAHLDQGKKIAELENGLSMTLTKNRQLRQMNENLCELAKNAEDVKAKVLNAQIVELEAKLREAESVLESKDKQIKNLTDDGTVIAQTAIFLQTNLTVAQERIKELEESLDHYIKLADEKREDARHYSEKVNELQASIAVKDAALEKIGKYLDRKGDWHEGEILIAQAFSKSSPNDLLEALKVVKISLESLHGIVELLGHEYRGYLPHEDYAPGEFHSSNSNLSTDTRTRLASIEDWIRAADLKKKDVLALLSRFV